MRYNQNNVLCVPVMLSCYKDKIQQDKLKKLNYHFSFSGVVQNPDVSLGKL